MTVYILSQGSYSDYRVIGICSTLEKARIFHNSLPPKSLNAIRLMKMDQLEPIPPGYKPFEVEMEYDGSSDVTEPDMSQFFGVDGGGFLPFQVQKNAIGTYTFFLFATDTIHAVKIANEHRTQMIAEGEWKP